MKKFTFRLESVHKVREIHKDRESSALAAAQAESADAASAEQRIASAEEQAAEEFRRGLAVGQSVDVAILAMNAERLAQLARMRAEAKDTLRTTQRKVDDHVVRVTEALRHVGVTDRLREIHKERHDQAIDRAEQSNVDELVSTRYARKITEDA